MTEIATSLLLFALVFVYSLSIAGSCAWMVHKKVEPGFVSVLIVVTPVVNSYLAVRYINIEEGSSTKFKAWCARMKELIIHIFSRDNRNE